MRAIALKLPSLIAKGDIQQKETGMNEGVTYMSTEFTLRLAREQSLPTALRLLYIALSRCDEKGRAEFEGWSELSACISPEGLTILDKSTIYKAVKRAVEMKWLAPSSSPSRLYLVDGCATIVERESTKVEEESTNDYGYSMSEDW